MQRKKILNSLSFAPSRDTRTPQSKNFFRSSENIWNQRRTARNDTFQFISHGESPFVRKRSEISLAAFLITDYHALRHITVRRKLDVCRSVHVKRTHVPRKQLCTEDTIKLSNGHNFLTLCLTVCKTVFHSKKAVLPVTLNNLKGKILSSKIAMQPANNGSNEQQQSDSFGSNDLANFPFFFPGSGKEPFLFNSASKGMFAPPINSGSGGGFPPKSTSRFSKFFVAFPFLQRGRDKNIYINGFSWPVRLCLLCSCTMQLHSLISDGAWSTSDHSKTSRGTCTEPELSHCMWQSRHFNQGLRRLLESVTASQKNFQGFISRSREHEWTHQRNIWRESLWWKPLRTGSLEP